MTTLIDTNVLLDITTNDPVWADWSIRHLDAAAIRGPLIMNDIVFAELSVGFETIEDLDDTAAISDILLVSMPRAALFLAGKVFRRYRAAKGTRTGTLPDFFIGAHAAVAGIPLLTRDARRYRTYFPAVELISP